MQAQRPAPPAHAPPALQDLKPSNVAVNEDCELRVSRPLERAHGPVWGGFQGGADEPGGCPRS